MLARPLHQVLAVYVAASELPARSQLPSSRLMHQHWLHLLVQLQVDNLERDAILGGDLCGPVGRQVIAGVVQDVLDAVPARGSCSTEQVQSVHASMQGKINCFTPAHATRAISSDPSSSFITQHLVLNYLICPVPHSSMLYHSRTGTSNLYRSAVAHGLEGLAMGSLTSSWKQYRLLPDASEDALTRRTRKGLSARLRSHTQSGKLQATTSVQPQVGDSWCVNQEFVGGALYLAACAQCLPRVQRGWHPSCWVGSLCTQ
jgi:hypothetical protein